MPRNSLKNVCRLIDEASSNLAPEQAFLIDLKRTIEKTVITDSRKPSKFYKPSSMNCIRAMWFQRVEADPDEATTTYSSVGITNSGTDIHLRVQTYVSRMKEFGIDCEYVDVGEYVKSRDLPIEVVSKNGMETKLFNPQLSLSFLCDGIVKYKNHYYILEIKTETSHKWMERNNVDPSHHLQGTAYSISLDIPEVIFVYINRDLLDMKAYMFVPTDDMKKAFVDKIEECESYAVSNTCPPKPEDVTKRTCNYCGYRKLCSKY